jgi:glycosyltransferase involved in cell wall biosynthesis
LKIAVNTRLLLKNKLEGIGWVAYETLNRISQQHPEHDFYFIFDRKYDEEFIFADNVHPVVAFPQARHPFLYYIWFEISLPLIMKRIKPDLFLSPDSHLSLSTRVPSLAIFHDLNFEHYPEDLPRMERMFNRYFFPKYARKAKRIVTVSEFSKRDIINQYNVSGDKIDVVYNGANELYKPINEGLKTKTRDRYTGGSPYFLFVGAVHPRKNIARLFRAFDIFKQQDKDNIKLLIVGNKKWWTREIRESYESMKYADEVLFSGRLPADELHKVIASALSLTYVSYFEGFGIPILEAFYCDVPVITSNITSMPEVAGDAALLVDPFSVKSIASALSEMAASEKLRRELIEKGRKRKEIFNWQKTADDLWKAIEKTLNEN